MCHVRSTAEPYKMTSEAEGPATRWSVWDKRLQGYLRGVLEPPITCSSSLTGSPEAGTRNTKPGTRNLNPGTRNSNPGTRHPRPGSRNTKPGTRTPEPEFRIPKPEQGRAPWSKGEIMPYASPRIQNIEVAEQLILGPYMPRVLGGAAVSYQREPLSTQNSKG